MVIEFMNWITFDPWGQFALAVTALVVAILSLVSSVITWRRMR